MTSIGREPPMDTGPRRGPTDDAPPAIGGAPQAHGVHRWSASPGQDPFDVPWAQSVEREVLAPMTDAWFRATIVGADRLPAHGPAILSANHSGNAFPYDGIVLDALLWRREDMQPERKVRTVYEHQLSLHWWMRPYGVPDFWRRGGGVDMTFDNFDRLLARGDRVLYFPEGVPGIGKGFNHRYELQRFSSSFVLLAARHGVPVVPIHIVNAEWVHPLGYTLRPVDVVFYRLFGVPFLPLPIGLLAIVLPFVWFIAFPARLVYVVGEPIDVWAALRAEGVTNLDDVSRKQVRLAAERIRQATQRELDAAVAEHGRTRYGVGSLFRALAARGRRWLGATPLGWPVKFLRHERDRHRPPARGRLHAFVRDLDLAAFYLPFGWPLLTLARRLRRPPYGYRGVSRDERRRREGEYLWKLSDDPLPERSGPARS